MCATQIRDWLRAGQTGDALLTNGDSSRPVRASDISVLVRSRREAALIRDALTLLAIPSVYLSNRDSVFETLEAQEMLWVLQAVMAPERENTLRSALATSMMGLTALDIETLNNDENAWDAVVEEFDGYRQIWHKRGVMPMLRALMSARNIAENLLATAGGERRLTDILHISELLQEAGSQLESEHALVRWLAQHILEPDSNASSQQLRLESDKHLVQIVTIHKSKGLEYPLVWLPFITHFRVQDQAFYHDRHSYEAVLDLSHAEESIALAEAERLAEDLRLLYVALTRAVWHCSLGVAPLVRRRSDKKGETDVHQSALGRLLQKANRWMPQAFAPVLRRYATRISCVERQATRITTAGKLPLHRTRNSAPERCNVCFMIAGASPVIPVCSSGDIAWRKILFLVSTLTPQALAKRRKRRQ